MIGWLNIASLILGLIAWILPTINLLKHESPSRSWMTLTFLSFSACSISLVFQIFSISEWVKVNDWTALMDTIGAIMTASSILIIGTIVLNGITLYLYRSR